MLCADNFLYVAVRDIGSSSESKSESGTSASSSARPTNPRGTPRADPGMAYVGPVPGRRPEKQVMMKPASHSVSLQCFHATSTHPLESALSLLFVMFM